MLLSISGFFHEYVLENQAEMMQCCTYFTICWDMRVFLSAFYKIVLKTNWNL